MSRTLLAVLLLTLAVSLPDTARAGAFCVVGESIPPQCLYNDVISCTTATVSGNTYCDINPDAHLMFYGSQRYCLVTSDKLAQCLYSDRNQCNADAGSRQAICIERQQEKNDISPYRYDNRIQR